MQHRKTLKVRRRKSQLVLAACLALTLTPVGAASAAKRPPRPGDVSAVDVYRESIPTSGGARPVGSGSSSGIPLSPTARANLEAVGSRGTELKRVATSPKLGAPTTRLRPVPARSHPGRSAVGSPRRRAPSAVGAITS